ncbi:SMP-30/gluconolactonase/LRE family protein [Roseimicrobium sp. ORNL1]|uniref:SMP-30/gluconolactonase/LRE family protein n=1 Tax=Roseimicrobium sp. ORNL1 TaxID=2711231 RepID=UPI0013E14042|nr:SMP-30/gluconolactonase/LRE family protein [Roseimicrobium sp. ORNL1]QIF03614.1 SMP-30/gluconolactonase/LRE family protein [Roseimicrobium sp. ORNL1]
MRLLSRLLLPVIATTLASCAGTSSPLASNAKPHDHGKIGAGEGPAWKEGSLYFTDGSHINRLDTETGKTTAFRSNCGAPNGLLFDHSGRLVACETTGRRLVRHEGTERTCGAGCDLESNPKVVVLADRYEGHRFNSPNDVTKDSKGRIYFTDPRYGPRDTMEMRDSQGRLVEGVYRVDAPGKVTRILGPDEVERPNGILVSHDDRYLYVADNNNNTHGGARKLWRFNLNADGTVKPGSRTLIFDWKDGRGPDGVKMDASGRLYVAAGVNKANPNETNEFKAGCYILSPAGKLLDFVPTAPDEATNCAFGGADGKTLYVTSGNHLWSVPLKK